jgi:uncharacterized protein YkwD
MKWLSPSWLLGLILVALGVGARGEDPAPKLSPDEQVILNLTNEARAKENLPKLKPNALLGQAAQAHAENMVRKNQMSHVLDGKTPGDRAKEAGYKFVTVGENLGHGPKLDPRKVFELWMNSPVHRKNILEEEYDEIGLAQVRDKGGEVWYVQEFGSTNNLRKTTKEQDDRQFQAALEKMVALTNEARAKEKLPPLKPNPVLNDIARAHSESMARQGKMNTLVDETGPTDGVGPKTPEPPRSEVNLAASTDLMEKRTFDDWMKGDVQRKNILDPEFAEVGIGFARSANGEVYYTQIFGIGKAGAAGDEQKFKEDVAKILDLTNAARAKEKQPPLKLNKLLCDVARAHSDNMARKGQLEHTLDGKKSNDRVLASGYPAQSVAENIGMSENGDTEQIFKDWIESPPHHASLVSDKYTEIGIGLGRNDKGEVYYTQLFARPKR